MFKYQWMIQWPTMTFVYIRNSKEEKPSKRVIHDKRYGAMPITVIHLIPGSKFVSAGMASPSKAITLCWYNARETSQTLAQYCTSASPMPPGRGVVVVLTWKSWLILRDIPGRRRGDPSLGLTRSFFLPLNKIFWPLLSQCWDSVRNVGWALSQCWLSPIC